MLQYGLMTSGFASDPELVTIAEEALSSLGPSPAPRAHECRLRSPPRSSHRDPARARALVDEAHEIARELDDPGHRAGPVLAPRRRSRPWLRSTVLDDAADLIDIGHRTGDRTFTIVGLETRAAAHREAGDLVEGDRAVAEYEALLGASELPHIQAFLAVLRSSREALSGDLDRRRARGPRDPHAREARRLRSGALVRVRARGRSGTTRTAWHGSRRSSAAPLEEEPGLRRLPAAPC